MVNRKKPRQKNVRLSNENFDRAREIREDYDISDADIFRSGLNQYRRVDRESRFKFDKEPKIPGFKFAKSEEDKRTVRTVKCENCGNSYQSTQKQGGSICTRCKYNSTELRKNFRMVNCEVCNQRYYTSRPRGSSKCWKCENINSEITEFVWQPPRTGVTRNKDKTAMAYHRISEERWAELDEFEKLDYIYDLPGVHLDESLASQHEGFQEKHRKFLEDEMVKSTKKMARDREDREE